jgi:hypothetical protein
VGSSTGPVGGQRLASGRRLRSGMYGGGWWWHGSVNWCSPIHDSNVEQRGHVGGGKGIIGTKSLQSSGLSVHSSVNR